LEVVLATSIALLLMFGFYVAIQIHLDLMQAGRDSVEEGSLARSLLQRMESDVASSLAPIAPPPTSTSTGATADASGTTTTPSTATTTTSTSPVFSIGVKGESTSISVYITRLTRSTIRPPQTEDGNTNQLGSDIRRITYYLNPEQGLMRQEVRLVTADDVNDPAATTEVEQANDLLAEEATDLGFRYFDGTNWVESWDGAAMGEDGKTPLGPPRAVEITVALRRPGNSGETKNYVHVIAFQAAPGAPSADTTTMPDTTTPAAP
jgi:hypothetical protein